MLPERQLAAWQTFYRSARKNEFLDDRTTLMIHLAAAMSLGCHP